jgi:HEPN domain-containing protein
VADSQFENLINLARRDSHMLRLAMTNPDLQSPGLFHAQQAIEKAFKAVLSAKNFPYPLTHNLLVLKKALVEMGIDCKVEDDILQKILPFGVEARYDEDIESLISMDEAYKVVTAVLNWAEHYRPAPI